MEVRRASADAQQQLTGDRTLECRMDEYLRSQGFYRKKIAKDGSCLFRAVAEQVLHCQSLHTDVRIACVKYLRQNRSTYELFIEGDFEKYLENLQDPQSWVGQVEIAALSKLYKRDFIVFQQPDEPPVSITENGFSDKVRLCFLNGNHYDSVYPQSFEKSAAVCQSVLYELLYDRVCGVDRSVLGSCMRGGRGRERLDSEECKSSEESDLEEDEFWSSEAREKATSEMKTRPSHRGRGRGRARDGGREYLSTKVQRSLNPGLYRNVEYDVWLRSKRLQQQRDFCMAAGMQYSVGDKCKVQMNGRFYSAYVQEVSPDNGPITVFIEELNKQQTVPLLNLRLPSGEPPSWQKMSEKNKRHPAPNNEHTASVWDNRGGRRSGKPAPHSASGGRVNKQHSWPPQNTADEQTAGRGKFRRSDQRNSPVCVLHPEEEENALLELLHKDEHNFPSLGTGPQTVTAEVTKRGGDKKSSRKKDHRGSVSEIDLTEAPQKAAQRRESNTTEKHEKKVPEERVQRSSPYISSVPKTALAPSHTNTPAAPLASDQTIQKTPVQTQKDSVSTHSPSVSVTPSTPVSKPTRQTIPVLATAEPKSHSPQPTQALSQNTPVSSSAPTQMTPVIPPASVQAPASVSAPDVPVKTIPSIQTVPEVPVSAPPPAPVQTTAPVLDTPDQSSKAPPIDGGNAPPTVQPTVDIHPVTSTTEPAQVPPPATPNISETHPCESLETPASGVASAPDPVSHPQQLLYPPLQWSHLLQDPLYPGFPQNEKGEVETLPPYSLSGEDLPQNINVLRFFFNLGIKAYSQPLWPPISYLGPLTQAHQMYRRAPPPSSGAPVNPTSMTPWQPENPPPPQTLSSTPDLSFESHSHAPGAPVGSVDMGGYHNHPPAIQMQVPPRPSIPWSAPSGPGTYPEAYPVQFSTPPCAPANQYPPSSIGFHLSPQPGPLEAINHVPQPMVRIQESGQRSMNPQFRSLQCFPGGQPLDFKPVNIPVTTMELPPYGSVGQPFPIGPLQGDIAGLNPLANGNLGRPDVFPKNLLVAEEAALIHHAYCPEDEQEFASVDLRVGQNFYSQSYRAGGRRGQDDRGGYRGRGYRGWKEHSGRGRYDEQPYGGRGHYVRRGAGPRVGSQ